MEKYGLSVAELEAQHVELLPDRIEMKRGKRNKVRCNNASVNFLAIPVISGNQVCLLQA